LTLRVFIDDLTLCVINKSRILPDAPAGAIHGEANS
jgi:hypothetical protein